jgi:hypothetical protein
MTGDRIGTPGDGLRMVTIDLRERDVFIAVRPA